MKHENGQVVTGENALGVVAGIGDKGGKTEQHPDGLREGTIGKSGETRSFKPKGSSITLVGSGRRDGSDIDNSMDLNTFYSFMLHNKP